MSYVVTFEDFTPPKREDGLNWRQVRIEESAVEVGPWTVLETQALSPLDVDSANPLTRSFTTELATLEEGWYRVTYIDLSLDESQPSEPIHNSPTAYLSYLPTVSQVAAIERARTRTSVGEGEGVFSADTRPTANQVSALIHIAAGDVTEETGLELPEAVWRNARNAILYRAAMLIELSYFPEQIDTNRSPYDRFERLYLAKMKTLVKAIEDAAEGGLPGAVDDSQLPSSGGFPTTGITMEGPM